MQPAVIADSERDTHTHTQTRKVETDGAKNKPSKIFNLLTQKTAPVLHVCTSRGHRGDRAMISLPTGTRDNVHATCYMLHAACCTVRRKVNESESRANKYNCCEKMITSCTEGFNEVTWHHVSLKGQCSTVMLHSDEKKQNI